MRIAVVNDTVYPFFKGGAQKRVFEISRRLVQRGHDVHWYGMNYGAAYTGGIKIHAVSPSYNLYTREGRRTISQALRFAVRLNIRERVDVIDCMNFPYLHCFRAKESALRQGVPLVITWFEYWGNYWHEYLGKLGLVGKAVERIVSHLPNVIVADSEKVKKQLEKVGVRDSKIRVILDGVDTKLAESAEPSRDKYDVVYVGRILPHKNVDMLVRAVSGTDATAAIIGTGSDEYRCRVLVEELGIGKRVKFLGHMPSDSDVCAIVKSAKVLVLPSVQEGHPLVIPEANACGTPVIGIKGVCDEFIDHGATGYLSEPNEQSLRALINQAIEVYPKFRGPCLADAHKYDWETIANQVEIVYRGIV